jgi:hypothetical protein
VSFLDRLLDSKLSRATEEAQLFKSKLGEFASQYEEVDTLGALSAGATAIHANPEQKNAIFTIGGGLATAANSAVNFHKNPDWFRQDPVPLVESLVERQEIPNLENIRIVWQNITETAYPQEPLDGPAAAWLRQFWQLLIEAGGGTVDFIEISPGGDPDPELPSVNVVLLEQPSLEITPQRVSLSNGETFRFEPVRTGPIDHDEIEFQVDGGTSAGTYMQGSELIIGEDEMSPVLHVVAFYKRDPRVVSAAVVNLPHNIKVTDEPERGSEITGIRLDAVPPIVEAGQSANINARVLPLDASQAVRYIVLDNDCPETRMVENSLVVSKYETSPSITIIVIAMQDASFTDKVEVGVSRRSIPDPDEVEIGFIGDKAIPLDSRAALRAVSPWAEWAQAQDGLIFIFGTTAHLYGEQPGLSLLSTQRARAARQMLIDAGVCASRILYKGMGSVNPWHTEQTGARGSASWEAAAQSNRKVVIMGDSSWARRIYDSRWQ